MKKINLFLDDFRDPEDAFFITHDTMYNKLEWACVRSYREFVDFIETIGIENIDIISYDHDLADCHYDREMNSEIDYSSYDEKTGYDCAKWLCDHCSDKNVKLPKYCVHSMNVIGKKNIDMYLKNFIKHIDNNII